MSERTRRILALAKGVPIHKYFEENSPDSPSESYNSDSTFIPSTSDDDTSESEKPNYTKEMTAMLKKTFQMNIDRPKEASDPFTIPISDIRNSSFLMINKYKKSICKFCEDKVVSKHFARHLERNHSNEREVREIFSCKSGSIERKRLLAILRNEGQLQSGVHGEIIPKKCLRSDDEICPDEYAICVYCKGFYKRLHLSRHMKTCFARPGQTTTKKLRPLSESIVFSACQRKHGEILNKLAVSTEILNKMQPDKVTEAAIGDILVTYLGEDLLKKNKNKRSLYHISNKLRECGKFLLEIQKLGDYTDMMSVLKPQHFENVIEATKRMSRYSIEDRSFGAASLALHFGTTLKKIADMAHKLILQAKIPLTVENVEKTLTDIERFQKIVTSQWTTEIGSLALKDLNEKSATKPKLLPITEDIMKLKNGIEGLAEQAYQKLKSSKSMEEYRTLAETTLVSTVLHNRKRVGDIQYLEIKSYQEQVESGKTATVQTEFTESLSENEKLLTQNYRRLISVGKGSRPVTILIPKSLQKYFSLLYNLRQNTTWFSPNNVYFFTYPKSLKWIDGCSVIRKYAKMCDTKHPELLTSCRLRKHIATVSQLLSLKGNEIDQLAKFMGHTTKTHEQFYKLPQDIYQVAKVSKILQVLERGNITMFKNKTLDEIEIDMENVEIDNDDGSEVPVLDPNGLNDPGPSEENIEKKCVIRSVTSKPSQRGKWSVAQKNIMRQHFKVNINKKKALRKQDCQTFLEKFSTEFHNVNWTRVKTFIYNEYK
nr:unnamed protein product [Callosobruchus analis]CAI5835642.1 unnamed protein product [Callosobruchus analis]CAI5837341.1 unnamed protein product [Callosobruchus analis]CAI5841072.1 unnamed protein product [Callosobruchus analis]CAI5842310.1 unnamed protein product [Callosobruchus analis]